jgi:hypothetical protein
MGRLVQLLLLIALVVIAWRLVRRALAPPAAPRADPAAFEPTARCARCGTHVPRAQLDAAGACARCRS